MSSIGPMIEPWVSSIEPLAMIEPWVSSIEPLAMIEPRVSSWAPMIDTWATSNWSRIILLLYFESSRKGCV